MVATKGFCMKFCQAFFSILIAGILHKQSGTAGTAADLALLTAGEL